MMMMMMMMMTSQYEGFIGWGSFTVSNWQVSVSGVGSAITCLLLRDLQQSSIPLASSRLFITSISVVSSSCFTISFPFWKSSITPFAIQNSYPISMGVSNSSDTRNIWCMCLSPNFRVKNTCFLTVCAFPLNAPTKTAFCVGYSRLSTPYNFSSLHNCSDKI